MKRALLIGAVLLTTGAIGQVKLSGQVNGSNGEGVPFAKVSEVKSGKVVSADVEGKYEIEVPKGPVEIQIVSIGFDPFNLKFVAQNDTNMTSEMKDVEGVLAELVVSGTLSEVTKRQSPIAIEVYSSKYLAKVPVPSLFQATQNINGVRPQINCAVCNTGDIHINGMEGPYTMVTIDGMPIVGGLSTVYGLQGIPNSMLSRVEVVKGPASTLYGSEAVAGLVNVITKNVDEAADAAFETSFTSWNELQVDGHAKLKGKKVSSIIGTSYYNYTKPIDKNGDNFTDLTLQHRNTVFNKLQFHRKENRVATLMMRYMYEDRWGGEMHWTPEFRGGDSIYGESIWTNRAEIIGQYQLPTKEKLMLSGSYSYHDQNSVYGDMSYIGDQHIGFGQLVWNKKAGNHELVSGAALRYNYYDDNTTATLNENNGAPQNAPDVWFIPGVFVQDNIHLSENARILGGIRYDYHTRHGNILTPRLNVKVEPSKKSEFRFGYGNGFRVVNLFTEDHAALTGARDVIIAEELRPERSNNFNLNYVQRIDAKHSMITLDASAFYTYFDNKIVPDFDTDVEKIIYANLDGNAVSTGISLNARVLFEGPLRINVGATIMDVYLTEPNEHGEMVKERQMFTEQYTGTWSISYAFKEAGVSVDYTGNLYGPMKLPIFENDFRPEYSPVFSIQNLRVSKSLGKWFTAYCGVRNLLDFTPTSASIMRSHDPFDKLVDDPVDNPNGYSFDPAYVYTSFQGRTYFVGLTYELFKK